MQTPRWTDPPSSSDSITIRPLGRGDLPTVATIHLRAFPHSALGKLGHETVRRYYEWQLVGPHEVVAIGAFSGVRLVGFCFGGCSAGPLPDSSGPIVASWLGACCGSPGCSPTPCSETGRQREHVLSGDQTVGTTQQYLKTIPSASSRSRSTLSIIAPGSAPSS